MMRLTTTRLKPRTTYLRILCTVGLVMIAAAAHAQTAPVARADTRFEVSGGAGYAKTWDDEGSIGPGATFGGSVLVPVTRTISIGGTVSRVSHDRETGAGTLHFQGDSTIAMATGKFTFGSARVQPFVSASFGVLSYSGVLTTGPPRDVPPFFSAPQIPIERHERSGTSTVAAGAGGVDIWITPHLAARPAMTIHMTQPNEDFMPWSIIGGGVAMAVRW